MNWFKQAKKEDCKGWTAVRLRSALANKIQQWGKDNILSDELAEDGRETDTHITLLYGICTKNREVVKKLLTTEKPIKATLGKIGCFVNNDEFDVIIVKVNSPDLEKLHKKIKNDLRIEQTHAEYKPHCTIAYVKKGNARKHAGNTNFEGAKMTFDTVLFKDGISETETIISLKG